MQSLFTGTAEDEVDFHAGAPELFEEAKRVNRAAGAGDSHYNSQIASQEIFFVPKSEQPFTNLIEARTDRKL
jgi:hypothetical protein